MYALLPRVPVTIRPSATTGLAETGQTLPARRRMKQRAEFEQALKANCLSNKWFAVYLKKNDCGFARLGIIASKRVMPKAVSRNLAKRMIREGFRHNFACGESLDVLVRAKRLIQPGMLVEGRSSLLHLLQTART